MWAPVNFCIDGHDGKFLGLGSSYVNDAPYQIRYAGPYVWKEVVHINTWITSIFEGSNIWITVGTSFISLGIQSGYRKD